MNPLRIDFGSYFCQPELIFKATKLFEALYCLHIIFGKKYDNNYINIMFLA